MSVYIFEGCGSQRSRRQKTSQSAACFLPALSFPASLSPVPSTWHSDSKAHLLGWALLSCGPSLCWKELGSVAVSISIVYPLNVGQLEMGNRSSCIHLLFPTACCRELCWLPGSKKSCCKEVARHSSLGSTWPWEQQAWEGNQPHRRPVEELQQSFRCIWAGDSRWDRQYPEAGQFEGDLPLLLYLSVIDGVASSCQCIVSCLFCDQSLMSRDLEMCEEVKETRRRQGVKNIPEGAWEKA